MPEDQRHAIRNIAQQALASWEAKDYHAAVAGRRKIMSLCRSPAQQNAALSGMALLKLEIDKGAASGNANAIEAAAPLARAGSQ